MSYSAFVVCNCFQNGKIEKPPHKEYVKFDEDGLYLDVPDEIWRKDEDKVFQMNSEFEKWNYAMNIFQTILECMTLDKLSKI